MNSGLFILIGVLLGQAVGVRLAMWTSERQDKKERSKITPEYVAAAYQRSFEEQSRVFEYLKANAAL